MLNKLNSFAFILGPIFYKVVYMSIIASFVGLVILIIRKIFSKKIPPKWISRLWLLVLIALVCPIQISSIFSVYNYIPDNTLILFNHTIDEIPNISFREEYDIAMQETKNILDENVSQSQKEQIQKNTDIAYMKTLTIDVILPYLWLVVSIILIVTYLITYGIFAIRIKKYKSSENERLLFILKKCKKKLKINKKIKIIEQDRIKTPSLFGIFNTCIIMPNNINNLSDYEIKYILMHELSHYKRKDNVLKICLTLVKDLYFFNPIIFLIYKQIIKDMEVATDELAVNGFDKENKKEYCKTLVKLTDESIERNFVAKTLAISDNKNNLERRIKMIKLSEGFIKHKVLISVILIIIILVLGALFLTKPTIEKLTKGDKTVENRQNILSETDALNLGKEMFNATKEHYWSWMTNDAKREGEMLKVKEENLNNIKALCTPIAFKQFTKYWNINVTNDGYCYFSEGIGANPRYISDELSIVKISENEIVFKDTVKYDDDPAIKENKFVLVRVGTNWLVEEFTSPY